MLKSIFISAFFFCFNISVFATENDYAVSKIPPALLEKASAIKRYEYVEYEIKDIGSATYYYRKAVTILNENGDKHAGWAEGYDKFSKITYIEATLYDADGQKLRVLKQSDIGDYSNSGDASLADDNRLKRHNFYYKVYPYTVEYIVEISRNELLFMPSWMPVDDEDFAVEKSVFRIKCPADYKIRYKCYQTDEPIITDEAKKKVYTWGIKNYGSIPDEFASPPWQKITPTVIVGATDFKIGDFKGNMNDWVGFGKFVYSLKKDKDKLPSDIAAAVHNIADKIPDTRKKIEALYTYMQQNTRYISIQLGIGGWQPFDAAYVAQKKYGDCKALTNYMYALLNEAGIRSVYTLIKAGDYARYMHEEFPAQQFNHVILSVPLTKDTMWLECTSQTLQAGYLSSFTCNRFALMVDQDGGHLVRTPSYSSKDNQQVRKINASIDEAGKLKADVVTNYSGTQQDDLFSLINSKTKKEQLEVLKKVIDLPNYDISSFNYTPLKTVIPSIIEKISLVAESYAQVSGKRIFVQPNLLSKSRFRPKEGERKFDLDLQADFRDIDTVEINIPSGYTIEAMPQPSSFKNKFGEYKVNFKVDGNKIVFTRFYEKRAGQFPKSDYPELVKMYNDVYKADRGKLVLVKKEG